jgi:predicted ATPase
VQTTPFVGRERELTEVASVLNEAGCQLVTLLGPGGVGKSRLSIETASRQFEHYADGVYFVPLAPLTSADSIVVTTAEAIHFSFVHPRDPKEQLLDHLRDKWMLLVMDNFEHLLAGASLITAIIKAAADVKVIVTSRVRLNLQAECLYEVGEMSFPTGTDDVAIEDFEAMQLFLTYARRAQPGYELGLKDHSAVAHICQLVGGMPLGVELAAAWVRILPIDEIAAELEGDLDLLETTMQDVPERQRSMRAAFDYSWNLLSAAEKDTFKKLSVFHGGFSRDAARHITGASLMALMGLIDKSLLRRNPAGRFELHELTRQYAAEKLAANPQQKQAVQDLHCDYYATMLYQQEQFLTRGGRSDEDVQHDIKNEIENIRTSWNWAISREKAEALAKSVFALGTFHEYQGTHHSLIELVGPALEKLESTAPEHESNLILGKLLLNQAEAFSRLGRVPEAIAMFERALILLDQPDGRPERGVALTFLTLTLTLFGDDQEKARHLADEALAIHREFGNLWGIGVTVDATALLMEMQGKPMQAKQLLQENIPIWEKLDSKVGLARVLVHLGGVANALGEHEDAKQFQTKALAILKPAKDYIFVALSLNYLGDAAYALGAYPEADQYYRESFQIAFKRKLMPMALPGIAGLALLLPKQNMSQTEKAVAILAFVLNHPAALNVALTGKRPALTELENELSPEKFIAAQKQSKTLDFETVVKELFA